MTGCHHFLVSGSVQGVFYRAAAQETARCLGLTGWVRNLADGTVEIVACGDTEKLKELEQWLWRGPSRARVKHVTATATVAQGYADFVVK